jgi:hypothetical protein
MLVDEADRRGCTIHFVTAWQMYLAIKAMGQGSDPVAAAHPGQIDRAGAGIERN